MSCGMAVEKYTGDVAQCRVCLFEDPADTDVGSPAAVESGGACQHHWTDQGVHDHAHAGVRAPRRVVPVFERVAVLDPPTRENRSTQEVGQTAELSQIAGSAEDVMATPQLAGAIRPECERRTEDEL